MLKDQRLECIEAIRTGALRIQVLDCIFSTQVQEAVEERRLFDLDHVCEGRPRQESRCRHMLYTSVLLRIEPCVYMVQKEKRANSGSSETTYALWNEDTLLADYSKLA